MYFSDFLRTIERHLNPSSQFKVLCTVRSREAWGTPEIVYVSLYDLDLPRREGVVRTGHTEDDWWRDSYLTKVAWHNGEVPRDDDPGEFREPEEGHYGGYGGLRDLYRRMPAVGYRTALRSLLQQGVLVPGGELDALLGDNSSKWAQPWLRFLRRQP